MDCARVDGSMFIGEMRVGRGILSNPSGVGWKWKLRHILTCLRFARRELVELCSTFASFAGGKFPT